MPGSEPKGQQDSAAVYCDRVTGNLLYNFWGQGGTDQLAVVPGGCDPATGKPVNMYKVTQQIAGQSEGVGK
jgi:hypothetical protein